MSNKVKYSLEAINNVSKLLLSQLDIQIIMVENTHNSAIDTDKNIFKNDVLLSLVDERKALIGQLFDEYSQDDLSPQLVLINEMVSLDTQLKLKSQHHKKILGEQVIKLKKSKKISNIYKKY